MAVTPEFTDADLVAVDRAIKSSALSVRFQDRTVEYRSMDELLRARAIIIASIGAATSTPIIRQSRVYTTKGM